MDTFEDSPTTDLVQELLARIEHTNGLEFVHFDSLKLLHNLLTDHLASIPNPYIFDPAAPHFEFRHPMPIGLMELIFKEQA
jgi:hypothetical protein